MSSITKENDSKLNEILGVVLLGLAALACAAVYFDAVGVFGSMARDIVFGVSGAFGYIVPILLGTAGVLMIARRRAEVHAGKRALMLLGFVLFISMWHLGVAGVISVQGGTYGMFLTDSYKMGASTHSGGGILGALLTYWTYTYLGMEGSWIVLIVGLAVCVLAVTNLSIRKLSADIGSAMKNSYEDHRVRANDVRERRRRQIETANESAGRSMYGDSLADAAVPMRGVGGRRKTPLPQPELDPPFSLQNNQNEARAPKQASKSRPAPVQQRPSINNVIELSTRKPIANKPALDEELTITAKMPTVEKRPARSPEPTAPPVPDDVPWDTEELPDPEEQYDPEPYREVFADTDIQFDDDPVPEVREKRRIDPELVERVTGKYAKVSVAESRPAYHVETGHNREGTAAVLAADADGRARHAATPGYTLPPVDLLDVAPKRARNASAEMQKNAALIEQTLLTFNVEARVVNILEGPVVTRYELELAPGVRVDRIGNLAGNLAMTLAASTIRIEAPVPGKSVVGIEVPNTVREMVGLRELLEDPKYANVSSPLAFALGKDITGTPVYADIAKMPHLLVAGQTGAGKSVCINSLIISILYRSSPDDVQMLMIDPKQVELSGYNAIPHLVSEVVTDAKKAPLALNWAVNEMNQRYNLFKKHHARNLAGYNEMLRAEGEKKLPHLLIIVDELAELMMTSGKEVEEAIQRIAQLGRAAGIHLVIATQRPTVKVITGLIKANVPGRIGFSVKSSVDSRTILDVNGAEKLLGKGDMLFYTTGLAAPERIQGCNVSDDEIARVVDFVQNQQGTWKTRLEFDDEERDSGGQSADEGEENGKDKLFQEAMRLAVENDGVSTSFLQRRLRIGYGRAARLLDELQLEGIISGPNGSKAREVLISREDFERIYGEDAM